MALGCAQGGGATGASCVIASSDIVTGASSRCSSVLLAAGGRLRSSGTACTTSTSTGDRHQQQLHQHPSPLFSTFISFGNAEADRADDNSLCTSTTGTHRNCCCTSASSRRGVVSPEAAQPKLSSILAKSSKHTSIGSGQLLEGPAKQSRRVRFADPLVSAAWSPPRKRLNEPEPIHDVTGDESFGPGGVLLADNTLARHGKLLSGDSRKDTALVVVENPTFGVDRSRVVPTRDNATMDRGIDGKEKLLSDDTLFLKTGSSTCTACQDPLLCGVGLAWILFVAGWFFFPLWYVGMFSSCIMSHRREIYGAAACSVGALVATSMMVLLVLDSKNVLVLYSEASMQL